MLYTLLVKPIALGALGLVIWVLWRATGHLAEAEQRGARIAVMAGAVAIAALILGPPAWEALTTRPGEVATWTIGIAVIGAVIWAYARLIGAARRKAGRRNGR